MPEENRDSAEQRLYEAATHWNADTGNRLPDLIQAACEALIEGLDSPSLRDLAGASVRDSSSDINDLIHHTLSELGIPRPGTIPSGFIVARGGGVVRRPGTDSLRLAVADAGDNARGGFQVEVYVNDIEMTTAGAGLGMDPYNLLIPDNRLVARQQPRTVPIARCSCGDYGCGSTDVTITRHDGWVGWDWSSQRPMNRGASFAAEAYDREVARVAQDHSWETPERTAGRLILTHLDREHLRANGLTPSWVATNHRDPGLFRVALHIGEHYQVFVDIPWDGRSPEDLADQACAVLAGHPHKWRASWHPIRSGSTDPPPMATRSWRRETF